MNLILSGFPSQAVGVTGSVVINSATTAVSSINTQGSIKTVVISNLMYMEEGSVYSTRVATNNGQSLNNIAFQGGYSVYFLRGVNDLIGKFLKAIGLFLFKG